MRRTICSLSTVSVLFLASLVPGEAMAAVGGPDLGGYSFADQADGAVYNYVDITMTGALVVTGAEEVASFTLGAPFDFYGNVFTDVVANTNGFLTNSLSSRIDATNDCPVPDPPSTGGSFRIYALHDDLDTSVFYQYFDEVAAAGLGYPGETAGISVIQWSGSHDGGGGVVDAEAILFHDDFSILTMVAADAEGGAGSTLGIQDARAATGLNYVCNTGGSVVPGSTAVLYTRAIDSDCCSASPTLSPGCTNLACQAVVCADDAFCCTNEWDGLCVDNPGTGGGALNLCPVLCGAPPAISINEVRIDQEGADNDEYIEIVGPPGTPLTDIQYIVLGDTGTGELESVTDLTGQVIPPSGFFVAAEASFTLGVADFTTTFNFENNDTVTHMLVGGLATIPSDNLDVDNDGTLDEQPWLAQLDTLALVHPPSTDLPYGPGSSCMAGPLCQELDDGINVPFHAFRCGTDGVGTFAIGATDVLAMPPSDSPGASNAMAPCCGNGITDPAEDCDDTGESAMCNADCTVAACGDGLINVTAGEDCDDVGESATCDADCTAVMCGDGVTNATAGEICDDGGESAMCNSDCTVAMCGDGIINMTAGEMCDDMVESAACNADCTVATCGDGIVNMTAGEICDDMGESVMCDDDCTAPMCGDGVTNMAAGEECDDMGESATCNDDCTIAVCGDSIVNTTAGETCDDGGRSDMCDADCTAVSCGDGVVNATAGEECDGDGMGAGGETEMCDDDCTNAMCGDGLVNATAGEDCDDMGESEDCNDDCTASACGDGVQNVTAGEECDDGNTEDGDGCAADCTMEEDPGTTGDTGDTGDTEDTGVDETAGPADSTGGSGGDTSATSGPSTVSASASASASAGATEGDTEGETDTDDTVGAVPGDEGCNCSTGGNGEGAPWSVLALFGLGALGRRRRRS